jgi:hypothetical protein
MQSYPMHTRVVMRPVSPIQYYNSGGYPASQNVLVTAVNYDSASGGAKDAHIVLEEYSAW